MGDPEWISDFDETLSLSRQAGDPMVHAVSLLYKYAVGLPNGCLMADDADLRKTGEALALAERYGDDFAVTSAKFARGLVLAHIRGPQCAEALDLLAYAAEAARREIFTMWILPIIDFEVAKKKACTGDLDGAIEMARALVDAEFAVGQLISRAPAVSLLVDFLIDRATEDDLREAQAAVDRLSADPTEPGVVINEMALLRGRAQLARAHGDTDTFQRIVRECREKATAYGFEGHLAMADAMTAD